MEERGHEPLELASLGPIVLNSDGTMSRIPNWAEMTSDEKASATRLIAKRNARRKEELLKQSEEGPLPGTGASAPPTVPTADDEGETNGSGPLLLHDNESKK